MPLIISQGKNSPRDNLDERKLVLLWKEGQQGEIDKKHWKANAVLKGGDDTKVRMGNWRVRDLEVGAKHDNQPSNNTFLGAETLHKRRSFVVVIVTVVVGVLVVGVLVVGVLVVGVLAVGVVNVIVNAVIVFAIAVRIVVVDVIAVRIVVVLVVVVLIVGQE